MKKLAILLIASTFAIACPFLTACDGGEEEEILAPDNNENAGNDNQDKVDNTAEIVKETSRRLPNATMIMVGSFPSSQILKKHCLANPLSTAWKVVMTIINTTNISRLRKNFSRRKTIMEI